MSCKRRIAEWLHSIRNFDENAIELRRISELKSRFLSNMSHEFRSPLNTILSMSAFLLNGSSGELTDEQGKEVGFIRKAAEGLWALVNDLLDLAKVEAGKAVIRPETFEIADLFESLKGTTRSLLIHWSWWSLSSTSLSGFRSSQQQTEGKVAQIQRNFQSNSAKFTEMVEIRISAKAGPGDKEIFTVTDTGIGIALADQRRVFEEFSQIEGPVLKRVKGTGLGLPLSRKLAELLGGRVSVRSVPGIGSSFFAVIPRFYRAPEEADVTLRVELAAGPSSSRPCSWLRTIRSTCCSTRNSWRDLAFKSSQLGPSARPRRVLRRVRPHSGACWTSCSMRRAAWTLLDEDEGARRPRGTSPSSS